MTKLPYRNRLDFSEKKFDLTRIFDQNLPPPLYDKGPNSIKPNGLWYQIQDCEFNWGEIFWGRYLHEIVLKPTSLTYIDKPTPTKNKILVIKSVDDVLKFQKLYRSGNSKKPIDWNKVSENYAGIEIKYYNSLLGYPDFLNPKNKRFDWLIAFDFSSGCIWNLNVVKSINFVKKLRFNKEKFINPNYKMEYETLHNPEHKYSKLC